MNVKASTGEGIGFVGRGEGVAALAVAACTLPLAHPEGRRSNKALPYLSLYLVAYVYTDKPRKLFLFQRHRSFLCVSFLTFLYFK